nr:hypothetical protein CFP56_68805 [Quercus suber]
MLKQFPDLGANHTPRALRKDVWRPFFTLSMPEGEQGLAQGLMAFRQLREWRKMHEVNWDISPLIARPHTEEEIQTIQEKLDNRGGSKTENVWDLLKRAKKKMRVHAIMNQKANSVADLATVLHDLDGSGKNILRQQVHELKEDREKEVRKMLRLADEHERGGREKLEQEIADVERQLEKPAKELDGMSKSNLRTSIYQLKGKQNQMRFAAQAVSLARKGRGEPLLVQSWRKNTFEESEMLQARAKQLLEIASQTHNLVQAASTNQISEVEALMKKSEAQGALPPVLRQIAYRKKLCEHVGVLADDVLTQFDEYNTAHPVGSKRSLWTLEQFMQKIWDPAVKIMEQAVDLARDEIRQEKYYKQIGWGVRVEELQSRLRRAKTILQKTEAMRDAAVKIPERNTNRPPVKLDPEAESLPETSGRELEASAAHSPGNESPPASMSSVVATEQPQRPARLVNPWHEFLPSFPPRETKNIPKRGSLRSKLSRLARPAFNTSGVQVYWENPLDAEFAESWPESVSHHSMGYARHVAPNPQEEPVEGSAELRARKVARAEAAVQPKSAKQVYLESLQSEILQEMTSKALAEQAAADLISERQNRRLIRNVGRHKRSVGRKIAREREAAATHGETVEVPLDS